MGDENSSIKITVCGELVDEKPEKASIEFTSVKLDSYCGLQPSKLPSTKTDQSDKELNFHWNNYDLLSETKTQGCPFIDSIKVSKYLLCVDKN